MAARKQSTPKTSSLASGILSGRTKVTKAAAKTLAASVLGQDETGKKKRRK
jgi:hypothetical protein